tara:strand:+ start:438 stop:767 length:330 start_codon:yes stop_codon:yes gene_type:complete
MTEDSCFKGSYSGSVDLELKGNFEGSLNVRSLYIKKSGNFIGFVSADNIVVEGKINADIQTENLHLKSSGIVEGEITYRNIIIDSGGLLKSDMVQNISSLNNLIRLNKS